MLEAIASRDGPVRPLGNAGRDENSPAPREFLAEELDLWDLTSSAPAMIAAGNSLPAALAASRSRCFFALNRSI
jgi:hypothetical protein